MVELGDALASVDLKAAVTERLAEHDAAVADYLEAAKRFAAVLNQASPEWETTDLHGDKHSVLGYRGKVMILDFWYRGCGWCMKAMPQVNEIAEHFSGDDVVVLGMSTDDNDSDAQFVVDHMHLTYPALHAKELPEKYGVQSFPTLIIIDQKGIVRDVHVGYSATLRRDVIASVDKLLAEP